MADGQTTIINMSKRKRKSNFSGNEIALLIELTEPHIEVLSSKLTNSITNERKKDIWKNICNSINAQGVDNRTWEEIKDKWQAMQKQAKSIASQSKKESQRTGGGASQHKLDPITEKMVSLYGACPTWAGISGGIETKPGRPTTAYSPTSQPTASTILTPMADGKSFLQVETQQEGRSDVINYSIYIYIIFLLHQYHI